MRVPIPRTPGGTYPAYDKIKPREATAVNADGFPACDLHSDAHREKVLRAAQSGSFGASIIEMLQAGLDPDDYFPKPW